VSYVGLLARQPAGPQDVINFERGRWSHFHTDEDGDVFGVTLEDGQQCPFCPPPDPNPTTLTVVAVDRELGRITWRAG
jgi:hypothetical protein